MTCVSVKVNKYNAYQRSLRPLRYASNAHATQPQTAATIETLRFQHMLCGFLLDLWVLRDGNDRREGVKRGVGGVRADEGNYPDECICVYGASLHRLSY